MTTTHEPRRIVLHCQCGACEVPFAVVQNGVLVIIARHGGDKHTNVVRPDQLAEMARQTVDVINAGRKLNHD